MPAHDVMKGKSLYFIVISFALSIFFFSPIRAHAATDTLVEQVIPPSANNSACAQLQVSELHPYIYEGALHSFEFTISNPTYVALGGTVGDSPVDFQYMSRWQDAQGMLRIHVDIPSTSLERDLPIHIVLLSGTGQVTCAASVSSIVPAVYQPHYPTNTGGGTPISNPPVTTGGSPSTPTGQTGNEGQGTVGTSGEATSAPMFVGALHSLGNLCQVGGASRLWIVLVVLYALFVLTLILQRPDSFGERTLEWNIALILVLFLGLVAFWYLSLSCRTGPWAPAASTGIAVIGLVGLMILGRPMTRPVLLLEKKEGEGSEKKK